MYCSQCGTQNPENAVFCKNCGASLFKQAEEKAENNVAAAEPVTNEEPKEESQQTQENYVSVNPVIQLIKKWSTSSLFLTATILFTVFIGLSSLGSLFTSAEDGGFTLSITGIIAMIGLWKLYATGKKNVREFDKSGLTTLKVAVIIDLVGICIALGVGGVALIIIGACLPSVIELVGAQWQDFINELQASFYAEGVDFGEVDINMLFSPEALTVFFISLGITLLGLLVFFIFFYVKAKKNIENIVSMIVTGTVTKNITMGFIVLMFIIGGISVLSFDWLSICEGVAYILFSIVLLKFKNEAEQLIGVVTETHQL